MLRCPTAPCILDAAPHLVHHFAIGAFSLVRADLECALDAVVSKAIISALIASGVRRTFAVRRELVHFKKACLHVLQEAQQLERGLVRHTQFFYREAQRCSETSEGHTCPQCSEWRTRRSHELRFCRRCRRTLVSLAAKDGEGDGDGDDDDEVTGSTQDDYLDVCERLHGLRGLRIAVQDTRNMIKTLCLLPRHVSSDADIVPTLRDMTSGFTAVGLIERAATDARAIGRADDHAADRAADHDASAVHPRRADQSAGGKSVRHGVANGGAIGLDASVAHGALERPLAALPAHLPAHVRHYVRQSLFARGVPKATAQERGAQLLERTLQSIHGRASTVLASVQSVREAARAALHFEGSSHGGLERGSMGDAALIDALRTEMRLGRHERTLCGLHIANDALLRTFALILEPLRREPSLSDAETQNAFVAGDAARGEQALWYPSTFAPLLAQLRRYRLAHGHYERRMRECMEVEGWPPPPSVGRTRVNDGGPLACRVCTRTFSRLWQERNVCWQCEQRLRVSATCPFGAAAAAVGPKQRRRRAQKAVAAAEEEVQGQRKLEEDEEEDAKTERRGKQASVGATVPSSTAGSLAGGGSSVCSPVHSSEPGAVERAAERAAVALAASHPFCKHQLRCAACDGGFELCLTCRLSQGDGDAVAAAIEAWRPSVLFLDFDLTLCSTRGGANPLAGAHSIDAELFAACVQLCEATGSDAACHVVTRNRHTGEIRQFLEERGVPIGTVHTSPSGEPKAVYMQSVLADGERAIFVDDSAAEIGEASVRADARIFRVLFAR